VAFSYERGSHVSLNARGQQLLSGRLSDPPGLLWRDKWTALQGYLAHEKTPSPYDPTRTLCIGLR